MLFVDPDIKICPDEPIFGADENEEGKKIFVIFSTNAH